MTPIFSDTAPRSDRRWPTPATCSTTTGLRKTSASSAVAGTPSTLAAIASRGISKSAPMCTPSWRSTSSPRCPSSKGSASRTAGPGSSAPVRGSAPSGAQPWTAASRTRWATRAWASPPRASASRWLSTSWGRADRAHAAPDGALAAAAVPARAAAPAAHRDHAPVHRARQTPRWAAQLVAAHARPLGLGFESQPKSSSSASTKITVSPVGVGRDWDRMEAQAIIECSFSP